MDLTPVSEDDEAPAPPIEGLFVRTYRWLDRFGTVRALDIFAERTRNARVWVYTPDDGEGRRLVAVVTAQGKFLRRAGVARACGMDTAASWNDLIEVCRHAHVAFNYGLHG